MNRIAIAFSIGLIFIWIPLADAKVKVGVICSRTGPYANVGNEIALTTDLFIRPQNKGIEVEICDDESTPQGASLCAERLVSKSKAIAIVGPSFPSAAEPVREILDKMGTPQISLAPERPDYMKRPRTFFRIGTSVGRLISVATDFVVNNLKPQYLGLILDNSLLLPSANWGSLFSDKYATKFQQFTHLSRDLPADIHKTNTDILLIQPQFSSEIIPLLRDFRALKILTYTTTGIGQFENWKNDRLYVVTTPTPNTQTALMFSKNFQSIFGVPPKAGFAFQAYAALEILEIVTHQLRAGEARKEIVNLIEGTTFQTILGAIRFNTAGDSNWPSEVVYRLRGEGPPVVAFAGKIDCSCSLADCCKIECCKKASCEGRCPTE